jgi:hypothetical protein
MKFRPASALLVALLLSAQGSGATAATAEQALRGKSVVVTWTEHRMQRRQGQSDWRPATRHGTFSVYISSAGRVFNRFSMRNPDRGQTGSRDRIGDGPRRNVSFSGRGMTVTQEALAGGARRIEVSFDDKWQSCTAGIIRGKEEGADKIVGQSLIRPEVVVEIKSSRTSAVRCEIKDGNVFAQE